MHRWLYRIFIGWYVIWFLVGLLFLATGWKPLFNHWEDMLFLALAGVVLFLHLQPLLGLRRTLAAFVWVALVSGVIEAVGATTGFPFGPYHYTETMGPRLGGLLPVAIPFAWWVVVVPLQLWWQARARGRMHYFVPLLVGTSAMLVDVALEPIATVLRGYWVWESGSFWYGVPLQNFLGWWLTATVISIGLLPLLRPNLSRKDQCVPLGLLGTVMASFLVAAVFAAMWPAALAIVVIILLLLAAYRSFPSRHR